MAIYISPDDSTKILQLAVEVCISTPKRQNKYARTAYVPWRVIHDLRDILEDVGIDIDGARKFAEEIIAERKRT